MHPKPFRGNQPCFWTNGNQDTWWQKPILVLIMVEKKHNKSKQRMSVTAVKSSSLHNPAGFLNPALLKPELYSNLRTDQRECAHQ